MDKYIKNAILNILEENKELLKIPLRQRAKFEGWLKFELAYYLEKDGNKDVGVEVQISNNGASSIRADISFCKDDVRYFVELKTPNTNWRIDGVNNSHRPITKNIDSIVSDNTKLINLDSGSKGIVAFVLFPIPEESDQYFKYLGRIGKQLISEDSYKMLTLDIDDNNKCNMLICSFFASKLL